MVVLLDSDDLENKIKQTCAWIRTNCSGSLNVAGPRESKHPGVYPLSYDLLTRLFGFQKQQDDFTISHFCTGTFKELRLGLWADS